MPSSDMQWQICWQCECSFRAGLIVILLGIDFEQIQLQHASTKNRN